MSLRRTVRLAAAVLALGGVLAVAGSEGWAGQNGGQTAIEELRKRAPQPDKPRGRFVDPVPKHLGFPGDIGDGGCHTQGCPSGEICVGVGVCVPEDDSNVVAPSAGGQSVWR